MKRTVLEGETPKVTLGGAAGVPDHSIFWMKETWSIAAPPPTGRLKIRFISLRRVTFRGHWLKQPRHPRG
jgi:hypothetical protein